MTFFTLIQNNILPNIAQLIFQAMAKLECEGRIRVLPFNIFESSPLNFNILWHNLVKQFFHSILLVIYSYDHTVRKFLNKLFWLIRVVYNCIIIL